MRPLLARLTSALTAVALCSSVTLPCFAQGEKLEQAKKHMEAGAAFYNDPNGHKCEEAFREFKSAYELSGSLNALKGMGVCALELERDGEAIAAFEKYLAGKGSQIEAADKTQMESDLNALKSSLATVTLKTDRNDVKITDTRTPSRGFPITNRYSVGVTGQKLGIHPGQHVFTASVEGQPDQTWKVDISNASKYERTFEFDKGKPIVADGFKQEDLGGKKDTGEKPEPAAGGTRPVPTVVYVAGIGTIVLGGVMAGMMIRAKGVNSTYQTDNGHKSAAELQDEQSSVKSANLLADVFLGATVVGAVVTTVLYVTRPTKPAAPAAGSWSVAPTVGRAGGGAALVGTF